MRAAIKLAVLIGFSSASLEGICMASPPPDSDYQPLSKHFESLWVFNSDFAEKELKAAIRYNINPDGEICNLHFGASSGLGIFDSSVLKAARSEREIFKKFAGLDSSIESIFEYSPANKKIVVTSHLEPVRQRRNTRPKDDH